MILTFVVFFFLLCVFVYSLNNNYFIFQYRETIAHSIVCKYLEWLPGEGKRVVSVDIDASESNVLVTCLDGFTTIIPIYVSFCLYIYIYIHIYI